MSPVSGLKNILQEHYDSVIRQHDAMINFIKERGETRLKETVCEHIEIFKKRIIRYLAS
jgi:DNA-binding FadR family transcriptional regulator